MKRMYGWIRTRSTHAMRDDNRTIPELIATAREAGITFALEEHGKLQMNEGASRTAPEPLVRDLMSRWREIEQWLRDNPES
jgi:hypothetical protein